MVGETAFTMVVFRLSSMYRERHQSLATAQPWLGHDDDRLQLHCELPPFERGNALGSRYLRVAKAL